MRSKVILDTNILISALGWGGGPLRILELLQQGAFLLLVSEEMMQEYRITLNNPKFQFPEEDISMILELVTAQGRPITNLPVVRRCRDPSDDKFLALAQAGDADFLVTGDAALLELKTHARTRIVTPKEFLRSL
jgi:uncharacterized protein